MNKLKLQTSTERKSMKISTFNLLCLIPIIFSSCADFHLQVFETRPLNKEIIPNGENYVFDNDTIRITYSFWGEKGILSYSLENKMNKSIYVDWNKSSFIINGKKYDYWEDQLISNTITTGSSSGISYRVPFSYTNGSVAASEYKSTSNTISEKPEKTTFIPPQSHIDKNNFLIFPYSYFDLTCNSTKIEVETRSDNPKKKTKVYKSYFENTNSPVKFRNYLAISFSDEGGKPFYIDNGFFVSTIKEVSKKHFRGKKTGRAYGNPTFEEPLKNQNNFYIEIELQENNFDFRNRNCK
jgi:hypothetical protein